MLWQSLDDTNYMLQHFLASSSVLTGSDLGFLKHCIVLLASRRSFSQTLLSSLANLFRVPSCKFWHFWQAWYTHLTIKPCEEGLYSDCLTFWSVSQVKQEERGRGGEDFCIFHHRHVWQYGWKALAISSWIYQYKQHSLTKRTLSFTLFVSFINQKRVRLPNYLEEIGQPFP